ncbi:hypothetical protein STCU_04848 [Strigomonas culicis]|nr:hypothetical protein STCU_04848 [Strigomonas culicis]|eukprot:EPY28853.1 hypothetical protein STCU_04848 [Strigomonas culicis]
MRFHQPGDPAFSVVAGAVVDNEEQNAMSERLANGDGWLTTDCHCLRCESLRVLDKLQSFQHVHRVHGGKVILVLLDLDNFGFNQFKSVPPQPAAGEPNCFAHIFVWCFFGSCFTRYHSFWPSDETVLLPFQQPGAAPQRAGALCVTGDSVWKHLVLNKQVHFTPCGGQSQGADNVIVEVVRSFSLTHPLILVTGDNGLLQYISSHTRSVGKKSRRDDDSRADTVDFASPNLDFVNTLVSGKRFIPVWRDLSSKVHQMVASGRRT